MNYEYYCLWYDSILKKISTLEKYRVAGILYVFYYDAVQAQAWVTEAGSAISAVFPPSHSCRKSWENLAPEMKPSAPRGGSLEQLFGVFVAAFVHVKEGRIGSLIDAVRVDTEDELLGQASALLNANHLAAAAVIAGGTLETHLGHLITKLGLTIAGEGSISKYDGAIAKARNDGTANIYAATDSRLVGSWGAIRNDAAHNPGTFNRSQEDVRRMIEGIQEFISRTAGA